MKATTTSSYLEGWGEVDGLTGCMDDDRSEDNRAVAETDDCPEAMSVRDLPDAE